MRAAQAALRSAGVISYQRDAESLLAYVLGVGRPDLYLRDLLISGADMARFEDLIKARASGAPLQYITGRADFFGLEFLVEPGVFIPRPETEALAENVILRSPKGDEESDMQKKRFFAPPKYGGVQNDIFSILDLCTGSGCIAICLAKRLNCGKIIAADISVKAVETAKKNAVLNGVADKIEFKQADLFDGMSGKYDLITCNPPYIKRPDIEFLPADVKKEPVIALDGGPDGLDFYRRIAALAPDYLKKGGMLALEMGDGQAEAVMEVIKEKNVFNNIDIIKDLNCVDRVVTARLKR